MKPIIRQDDTLTPFGGQVLEGHSDHYGKPIACRGDAVLCNHHGLTRIAEGTDTYIVDNCPVALHGHRCECGCTLVSSMPDSWVSP